MFDPNEIEKYEKDGWDWFTIGGVAFLLAFGIANLVAIYG